MKILVTNDDGIASPGLHALAAAMRAVGEVYVVAPDRERTAISHALTLHKPLRISRLENRVYAINGTPTDCVNLALKKILRARPALLMSGVNRGLNLGDDVTYSGTVSAALEGAIMGVPSIAVSQEGRDKFRFDLAAAYALRIARVVLARGMPPETLLNINVPDRTRSAIKGVRVTRLGRRRFDNPIVEKTDPHGRKYYWIAGTRVAWGTRPDSDHVALRQGWVSVTPIHLDLTHHEMLGVLSEWEPCMNGRRRPARPTQTGRRRAASSRAS